MEEKSKDYPRSLYMGGDRNAAHLIVNDAEEEKAARKGGYKNLDEVEGQKADKAKK